jgi:hypothetical protein
MKGIGMAQPWYDHKNWATPMPFASINSTNPRNNPWSHEVKS